MLESYSTRRSSSKVLFGDDVQVCDSAANRFPIGLSFGFLTRHDPTLELAAWCVENSRYLCATPSAPTDPCETLQDEALGWGIAAGVCYFAYKLVFGEWASCHVVGKPTPGLLTLDRSFPLLQNRALTASSSPVPGSSTRRRQVSQASIDQITTMFPNVSQNAARWELERNGGNVERAVERALREGGLPEVRLLLSSCVRMTLVASSGGLFICQEAAPSRTKRCGSGV